MAHEDEASTVSIIRLGFTAFYAPTEPKQAEAAIESVALNPCIYVRVRKAEGCRRLKILVMCDAVDLRFVGLWGNFPGIPSQGRRSQRAFIRS